MYEELSFKLNEPIPDPYKVVEPNADGGAPALVAYWADAEPEPYTEPDAYTDAEPEPYAVEP